MLLYSTTRASRDQLGVHFCTRALHIDEIKLIDGDYTKEPLEDVVVELS